MVEIGKFNLLRIEKERSVGYFFDGGDDGDILMPKRHQPDHCEVGDELYVFIFRDAEERLTATVRIPYAQVDEVAWLKVIDVHRIGAFMDWGMTKDLLIPFREQAEEMVKDQYYLVYILLDESDRIVGSTRLEEHLSEFNAGVFKAGQEVDLIVADVNDLGYKVVINHSHLGLLYGNEVFQPIRPGQKLAGFIKKIREDDKLDISLQPQGYNPKHFADLGEQILDEIKTQGGFIDISDKSPPEVIYATFKVSKKSFKQAVGKLYKERLITIEPGGLRLVNKAGGYRPGASRR